MFSHSQSDEFLLTGTGSAPRHSGVTFLKGIQKHQVLSFLLALQLSLTAPPFVSTSDAKERVSAELDKVSDTVSVEMSSNRASLDQLFGRTVREIHVEGLRKIQEEAVVQKILTKVGSRLTANTSELDILNLFGMGYFEEIEIRGVAHGRDQVDLIYVIKERPVISNVEFVGNEQISTSDLKEVTKVKTWSILDVSQVQRDVERIERHYEEKGFYLARVSYEIKVIDEGEVELHFKINDFEKVQIKKITFLNNKHFSDDELKSIMSETREGNFLSFMTDAGNFKDTGFKQDLQKLLVWYLDHGFVKFRYETPVINVSEDKRWLYISIYVEEGDQYSVDQVDFGGDLLFTKEELTEGLHLEKGNVFSIIKRNQDILKLSEKYQDLGYAFVNVVPKMELHDEQKTLDITYEFEPGELVYFREVNVTGNDKTHDKVIRRELKVHEGELFSGSLLRESKENVERLGFFAPGEVAFKTIPVNGRKDQVDIEISIKERSTGTITLGAGYGSFQGFFFTTQISEINLFGRGQTLSLAIQYSIQVNNRSLNLGFTEPYTFDTLWTTGFDLYYVNFPIPNRYTVRRTGFDIRLGHPIFEYTQAFFTYKFEGIAANDRVQSVPQAFVDADTGILSSATVSVVRDKRNNRFETTGGNYQSISLEAAGLGGDMKFLKWVANNRFYHQIVGDLVFRHNVEVGHIRPFGSRPLPPSQKFYLGGPNNMRGYNLFLLGPQVIDSNNQTQPLGGEFQAYTSFELEYPIVRSAGIKLVTFFDAGNAWQRLPTGDEPFTIRTDVGFGIRWFSPMGPLRFEWGFPLGRKPNEQSPVFQFMIGPPF